MSDRRLEAELCTSPVTSLVVVLDGGISLQAKPLRNRLVALGSNTDGALDLERLV